MCATVAIRLSRRRSFVPAPELFDTNMEFTVTDYLLRLETLLNIKKSGVKLISYGAFKNLREDVQ
jgi:hypothetical protein